MDCKDKWESLKNECLSCRRCALADGRTNIVFGDGNRNAEVLFIGEGPGAEEDKQGKPFVGRAGKLLDDMLEIIGLDRTKIFIANIVKCRPPGNRDPLSYEQDACISWLERQIELIDPKIIVCLGRIAATRMIKSEFKITKEHGVFFLRGNARIMAIYHPAALLRDPYKKPDTFEDLKTLQAEIRRSCTRTY
ncbi:MAG: uracil-DNA glycosylase [Oscillospiraceae bacterium]|jgi:uracil-DNA glycosylase family 4